MGTARARKRNRQSTEYKLLLSATLCLLAFGAVMVFSASSATSLLGGSGDSAYYFKRTVLYGAAGLIVMRLLSARGVRVLRTITPLFLVGSFALLIAVLVPGIGVGANGAHRWIGAGAIQVQPSELTKLALILYGAHLLATKPRTVRDVRSMLPYLLVVAAACLLIVIEPDLGTAIVSVFSVTTVLIAGGARFRHLVLVGAGVGLVALVVIAFQPYMRSRLTGFLHPGADAGGAGFQAVQAQIALGSGGVFGVGLGESVQKIFYLPEAHTDMIAAVIGEEIGLFGISILVGLYSVFGYAGFRIAQGARDRYGKLLAAGLTALVLTQAVINLFAVLGLAPLTGVPLPFVSYGNSSLLVMMACAGLILNVAAGGTARAGASGNRRSRHAAGRGAKPRARASVRPGKLHLVEGGQRSTTRRRTASGAKSRDSRGGNRGARRSRHSGRRRAAG